MSQQSEFIAMLSHELRNYLGITMFQLEDIMVKHGNNSLVSKDICTIKNSLYGLGNLVDTLFKVEQYEFKKASLELERHDVIDLIQIVFEHFKVMFDYKGREFTFTKSISHQSFYMYFDYCKVQQVITNILNNALKFSKNRVNIHLNIKDNKCSISISDDGPGVKRSEKKAIFKKFITGKSNDNPGLGMGLYLCKKIIELHKGKIYVEESVLDGANFVVTLPIINKS